MAAKLDKILAGCRKGRPGSQEALYRMFSAAMYGICLQYASGEEDAKDMLQEGFIKVFTKLHQVRNPAAFPGWIRRVMINTALEKYRGQVQMEPVDEVHGIRDEPADDTVFSRLVAEELVELIRTLTPAYRMVFNLFAIEGYSHQEIAEELGISEGTSKSNLSRARAILQKKIERLYGSVNAK